MMVGKKWKIAAAFFGLSFVHGCGQMAGERNGPLSMNQPGTRTRAVSGDPAELRIPALLAQQGNTPSPASPGSQPGTLPTDLPLVPIPPVPRANPGNPLQPVANVPGSNPATPANNPLNIPQAENSQPADPMRTLQRKALARLATLDSYIVRLTRREVINGKKKPEELLLLKYRKAPLSIYFKWLGGEGAGREVVFVEGQYEGKIHTLLAAGDIPFMPAGKRMALSPDSILVKNSSRHKIQEAGFQPLVSGLGLAMDAQAQGDRRLGSVRYHASVARPDLPMPMEALEHLLPPGMESGLPRGGRRLVFFDPQSFLPALIATYDERGEEVEFYRYDRFQFPVRLDEKDFNPEALFAKPGSGTTALRK
ncbi:MAG: DUF1571 domain-containing protein [Gemmataceae bacterium]|nr:DUF1571 domain-containing protein [Gemmataceae bacterium]